jgi:uncharacterized damage-inducible protein DinB
MTHADEFRRLFAYEQDAHADTLASLKAAEPAHRDHADFAKAIELAAHIATCRDMWLGRLHGDRNRPATLFPSVVSLADVVGAFERTHANWSKYLERLDDPELDRPFEYAGYDGGRYRDCVRNVLIQLFGHSLYHRGQIALLLRRIGAEPASTDFVFWTRQAIEV